MLHANSCLEVKKEFLKKLLKPIYNSLQVTKKIYIFLYFQALGYRKTRVVK